VPVDDVERLLGKVKSDSKLYPPDEVKFPLFERIIWFLSRKESRSHLINRLVLFTRLLTVGGWTSLMNNGMPSQNTFPMTLFEKIGGDGLGVIVEPF